MAALAELWQFRRLIVTLVERERRALYKQAVLGFAWSFVGPLSLLILLALLFNRALHVHTGGVPYPLFAYLGLLPWTFFSNSLTLANQSLLANAPLLNKVYCPREVFPLAGVAVAGIDMAIASLALVVLFPLTGYSPQLTLPLVPSLMLLVAVQLAFTIGLALIVSVVVVYLRDVRHLLPIVLQLGILATPVAYGLSAIPASFRTLYCVLNPLAPVIDGYRRTVLHGVPPRWSYLGPGAISASIVLVVGYALFKRLETGLADVA